MKRPTSWAMRQVPCPTCGAGTREFCRARHVSHDGKTGTHEVWSIHAARRDTYTRLNQMDGARERVRAALTASGISDTENLGPHSWRCEYPHAYGPCSCVSELVDDILKAVAQ